MKIRFLLLCSLVLTCAAARADDAPATFNIVTRDGQTYKNVTIEDVNPGGIDIGFTNAEGFYVLKGLSFNILPEDLQKRFGYDPVKSEDFNRKVATYADKEMPQVAENEKARLERITKEIKAKFAGQNITIKPDDLRFAIQAGRRSVVVEPQTATRTGCVVKISKLESGKAIKSELVQVDGLNLPQGEQWSGFIYPTGLKANYQGQVLPVFSDNLDDAAGLVTHYLEIYSEYAAANSSDQNAGSESAPDQALTPSNNQSQTSAGTQAAPPQQQTTAQTAAATDSSGSSGSVTNNYYYGDGYNNDGYNDGYYYGGGYPGYYGGYYGGYYIGNNYGPVNWWNNRHHHYGPGPHPGPHPKPHPGPRPEPRIGTPANPAYSQPGSKIPESVRLGYNPMNATTAKPPWNQSRPEPRAAVGTPANPAYAQPGWQIPESLRLGYDPMRATTSRPPWDTRSNRNWNSGNFRPSHNSGGFRSSGFRGGGFRR